MDNNQAINFNTKEENNVKLRDTLFQKIPKN